MSDGLELVTESIRAAKEATKAAYHALLAVERLLEKAPADEKIEHETETTCRHEKASRVNTTLGEFVICECGHQEQTN